MSTDLTSDTQVQSVKRDLAPILASAIALRIESQDGYIQAGRNLTFLKTGIAAIEAARVRITKPMNEALKAVNEEARNSSAPLLQAELSLKRAILAYQDEQERKRREEQRRADESARIERQRLEAERRENEERARLERERLTREAEEARKAGDALAATHLENRAVAVEARAEVRSETLEERKAETVAPELTAAPPKVAGIASKGVWKAEVTDKKALVRAVADDLVPLTAVDVSTTVLGQMARALKQDLKWPGIRVWEERGIAAGRG